MGFIISYYTHLQSAGSTESIEQTKKLYYPKQYNDWANYL